MKVNKLKDYIYLCSSDTQKREMATANPFDILGDDDNNEDLSQLVAAAQLKAAEKPKKADKTAAAPTSQPARLPTKPAPPAQAGEL